MPDSSDNLNTSVSAMAPDASTSPVEWSRPIEAVHPKFGVFPATYCPQYTEEGRHFIRWHIDGSGGSGAFYDSGASTMGQDWIVRNVQPTTPERDPALWDRMVGAVLETLRIFEERDEVEAGEEAFVERLRAIAADLSKPVDPDLLLARQCVIETLKPEDHRRCNCREKIAAGEWDNGHKVRIALAAIKRGRELAGEQA